MRKSLNSHKKTAFTLIETVLALAVVGILLLAVFGVTGVALSANQSAVSQTGASNVLAAILADVRSASKTASASPIYQIALPNANDATSQNPTTFYLSNDDQLVETATAATYQVNYWTTGSTPTCQESTVRVLVSWPPGAPYASAKGYVETVIFINRVP